MARPVVCVQGLGFVGAAMAAAVASAMDGQGHPLYQVVGVDLPTPDGLARIEALCQGRFPFATADHDLEAAVANAVARGNLTATADPSVYADAQVIVVDVHLDVDFDHNTVDFEPFRRAIGAFATVMREDALVLVETTVPPGTCQHVAAPALAAAFRARGLDESKVLLAHSYERVMPGADYLASIINYWRVYSGHTPAAAARAREFLASVIHVDRYPLTALHSTTASEMAKVMENSYRATTIAFIEEWARFAEGVGVDLFQVVEAIRLRPTHSNMRQPGFGVGGYCLTKDPLFAGIAARVLWGKDMAFPFCEMAVETNRVMPVVSLDRLAGMLDGDLTGRTILLMGVSYRQDVADTRYSPSETFVIEARRRGAKVLACDPMLDHWQELDMAVADIAPHAPKVDAVVFAVPHKEFRAIAVAEWLNGATPAILDSNDVLTAAQRAGAREAGCRVASIGRGN